MNFPILISRCNHSLLKVNDLHHIKLIVNYPLVEFEENKLSNLKDTIPIYYWENYVFYNIPYKKTFEIDERLINEEVKYSYFLFKKGNIYGYLFNSLDDTSLPQKLQVDSFLFRRAYAAKFDLKFKSLVEVKGDKHNNSLIEKYVPENINNETYFDTIIFYFDKRLNGIDFSFSKDLDSAKEKKLYKVRLLYNEKFSATYQMMVPKREMLFEIQNMPIKNPTALKGFFQNLRNRIPKED